MIIKETVRNIDGWLKIDIKFKKKESGSYLILNKETGEEIGKVYKKRNGDWGASAKYVGVVARFRNSRKAATEMAVGSYLIKRYRRQQK